MWIRFNQPCPHCQQVFFRPLRLKGLRFCPHCQHSILGHDPAPAVLQPSLAGNSDKLRRSLGWRLVVALGSAALIMTMDPWLTGHPAFKKLFFAIGMMVILGFIVRDVLKNKTLSRRFHAGRDQYATVQADTCPQYGSAQMIATPHELLCPQCHSQRLADAYWYTRSLAERGQVAGPCFHTVPAETLVGCLQCGHLYTHQRVIPAETENPRVVWAVGLGLLALVGGVWASARQDPLLWTDLARLIHDHAWVSKLLQGALLALWFFVALSQPVRPGPLTGQFIHRLYPLDESA